MAFERKDIIINTFTDHANNPAVISPDSRLSFCRLGNAVNAASEKLRLIQIEENEPVAIIQNNCVQYIILLLALWKRGAVAVPVSTRWPEKLIKESLYSIPCHKIITHGKSEPKPNDQFTLFDLNQLVSLDIQNNTNAGFISFDPDRAVSIIFTSGSTGSPKAVLHSFGNHYYNALGSQKNIPFTAGDRWLLTLPIYHVGGLSIIFRFLMNGGTIVIPDEQKSLADNIDQNQISHISLVSTQLHRLLAGEKDVKKLKSLKAILLGGGVIPEQLVKKAFGLGLPIHTSYGSTEMASQITTTRPGDLLDRLLTSGQILPYRDLKIGTDNEIMVRGKTLCPGYIWGNKVIPPVNAEGWFRTGDLGFLDSQGYLVVTGRKDNMFISGGENIQPEEIEKQLNNIPGIEQSLVVPVTNIEFGHRPVAFIKSHSNHPDIENIKKRLKDILPRFKIPDYFLPWPEEKRSGIKPDRRFFVNLAEKILNTAKPD
ncbi:o-succinylbenzoate--CoA ligase [candidate division KSB1 bacterium]|nr:o-succinylbenzoate--CoA ligase [candidate division KSB1 bacterium]